MLLSMTGYGRHTLSNDRFQITVELRSLNSKFLEIHPRLPSIFRSKEAEIRSSLAELAIRGKLELSVHYQYLGLSNVQQINSELIRAYFIEFQKATEGLNVSESSIFSSVMRMPNVTYSPDDTLPAELWEAYQAAFKLATQDFIGFREREGAVVEADFSACNTRIQANLAEIAAIDSQRLDDRKNRLRSQLQELNDKISVDENRFEQEIIYYIEKVDISEEKSRLSEHCKYFAKTLKANLPEKGKKLNFIAQEMGREINTIGSKANHFETQRFVVEMKEDLEKIKEQSANIV